MNHLTKIGAPCRWLLWLCCFFVGAISTQAQDVHFTQFYADPLFLNPAHTGYFQGAYRLGANYKAQWPFAISSGMGTYNSYAAYADFSAFEKKINPLDWMGFGLHFNGDYAGDGKLSIQKVQGSLAYHKGFDKLNRFVLSAGYCVSWVQRSIDFEKLYFNNQWTGEGFDASQPNYEPFRSPRHGYLDMSSGISLHMSLSDPHQLEISASLMHLNRPRDTYYNSLNRLAIRPLLSIQYDYRLPTDSRLMAALYFSEDKSASETAMALLYAQQLGERKSGSALDFGLHMRFGDAIAPAIGYEFHQTRILFNYDVNISGLTNGSKGNGGPEISIVHIGNRRKAPENKVHCPVF